MAYTTSQPEGSMRLAALWPKFMRHLSRGFQLIPGDNRGGGVHIDSLEFGRINIDGQTFTTDVLIFPDGSVQDQWRRARGHVLGREDLTPLLAAGSGEIIVGTGMHGRMRPAPGLVADLAAEGVRLTTLANGEARKTYNRRLKAEAEGRRLAACFHLTC